MEKIASFTIDHIKLERGLYVSRIDRFGETAITTFDIRLTSPNDEPVLNTAELHTIEHLCATLARNDSRWADRIVYFGPMGERSSREMVPFVTKMFEFVRDFEGDIPGAKPEECGNYLDQNLPMAKFVAKRYLENTLYNIDDAHLNYPE